MAELFIKTFPIDRAKPVWEHGIGRDKFILEMDEYEIANLRFLMESLWGGIIPIPAKHGGDWIGQIRHALMDGTKDHLLQRANGE